MSYAAVPQAGLAEAADRLAERNLEQRLMPCGLERPEGDACPICFLLIELPVDEHAKTKACCMKSVCDGCVLAARQRGINGLCEFCRTPVPTDDTSTLAMVQKRVDKGDAEAICCLGNTYYHALL